MRDKAYYENWIKMIEERESFDAQISKYSHYFFSQKNHSVDDWLDYLELMRVYDKWVSQMYVTLIQSQTECIKHGKEAERLLKQKPNPNGIVESQNPQTTTKLYYHSKLFHALQPRLRALQIEQDTRDEFIKRINEKIDSKMKLENPDLYWKLEKERTLGRV